MEGTGSVSTTQRGSDQGEGTGGEMTDHLMYEKLIAGLAASERAVPASEQGFAAACERADSDPREQRRIRDITDLIEAEDVIYDQALAALDRGDHAAAVPLLRRSADAEIGDSAWFLAVALEKGGNLAEALTWYARAAEDGDERAASRLAAEQLPLDQDSPPAGQEGTPRCCPLNMPGLGMSWLAGPDGGHDALFTSHHGSRDGLECDAVERIVALDHAVALMSVLCTRPDEDHTEDAWWPGRSGSNHWLVEVKRVSPTARRIMALRRLLTSSYLARWPDEQAVMLSGTRIPAAVSCLASRTLANGWPGRHLPVLYRLDDHLQAWWSVPLVGPGRPHRPRVIEGGLTAEDVMLPLPAVPALAPGTTVHQALDQMLQSGVRAMPVGESGRVAGVIVLADLAQLVYQAPGMPSIRRVETLMRPATTVPDGMPLDKARSAAAGDTAGFLVVVRPDGSAVGYLTPEVLLSSPASPAGDGAPARDGRPRASRTPGGLLLAEVR
jgi:CBS domain-containing protein